MPTSNAVRFLNSGTSDYDLLREIFNEMVLDAFHAATVFLDMEGSICDVKEIGNTNSHQFIIGDNEDNDAEYHTPGIELLGQNYSFDDGSITIDQILVSHHDIPLDQQKLSSFDVISKIARKQGRTLAQRLDRNIAIMGFNAALTAANTGFHNGGNIVERVGAGLASTFPATSTGAAYFRDDAAQLAQLMDEDNVPESDRWLFVSPYIVRVLEKDLTLFSRDYQPDMTNEVNKRVIGILEGFKVIKTNHLPSTNITTGPSKYQGDFRYTGSKTLCAGLALCGATEAQAAIGYVQSGGISSVLMPDHRRNTTFMKSQIMCGMDVLAPYCAGVVTVDDA